MKKRIFTLILALLCLCGCGKNDAPPLHSTDHADVLLSSGAFEGSDMAPLEAPVIAILYGIDPATIAQSRGYMATNTSVSADELVILVLTDEEAAIAAEEACKARVAAQIKVCESYAPAAVPRLEQALISRRGNTVLFAVGDREILDSIMDEKNI